MRFSSVGFQTTVQSMFRCTRTTFYSTIHKRAPSSLSVSSHFQYHPQSSQGFSLYSNKSIIRSINSKTNTDQSQTEDFSMITGPVVEMLARNSKFAETYQSPPPLLELIKPMRASGAGVVVLSCSDPRLNPYQVLGIDGKTLKATMIRNAGGRAFDAIRSMAVLQTIGAPGTIVVMHHTDCGMTHFHDDAIKEALTELAPEEKSSIEASKFGEITGSIEDSVREDIALIRASPLIKKTTQIVGLKYDIHTGTLTQVQEIQSEL